MNTRLGYKKEGVGRYPFEFKKKVSNYFQNYGMKRTLTKYPNISIDNIKLGIMVCRHQQQYKDIVHRRYTTGQKLEFLDLYKKYGFRTAINKIHVQRLVALKWIQQNKTKTLSTAIDKVNIRSKKLIQLRKKTLFELNKKEIIEVIKAESKYYGHFSHGANNIIRYQTADRLMEKKLCSATIIFLICEISKSAFYDGIRRNRPKFNAWSQTTADDVSGARKNGGDYMGRIRLKRLIEEKFGNRYSEYKISRYLIDLGITTRLRNNKRSLPETERVKEEGLINLLGNKETHKPDFSIAKKPDDVGLTDMSCLKRAKDNNGQHLYLGVYIDLKSRFVVGYFFTGLNKIHIDTKNAFKKILRRRIMINGKSLKIRRPKIHHSDRGSNYTALEYHSYLTSHKILQSGGLKSYPQCNAPNESFFSTLKMEININSLSKMNNDVIVHEVKKGIKKYNNERFHSSIGKKPFEVYFKKELGNNKLVK